MNLIRFALRKPIAIMVLVLAIGIISFSAIKKIKVDIFPEVELPSMYIAMPYGGLSPQYMDGFMANEFQKVLLFVGGVKNIDFKSVQGLTLMKLTFTPEQIWRRLPEKYRRRFPERWGFCLREQYLQWSCVLTEIHFLWDN